MPLEEIVSPTHEAPDAEIASRPLAIEVRNLVKAFEIPLQRVDSIKERVLHPLEGFPTRRLVALRDISFDVHRGEFFGIVGRNGTGKSTLLKILAEIYRADAGSIRMAGRVAPFIELGVGFNPDLTARENVILNGVLMGLGREAAEGSVDAVIEFAELEEFADLKLKNYSSGMLVRLAFSIMIQSDADILLIDEVLAVGDAAFQQKCKDVFHEIRGSGRTVVLVTHDMSAVEQYCHRAMLLDGGDIAAIGDPDEVAHRYLRLNFATSTGGEDAHPVAPEGAEILLLDAWLESEGERTTNVEQGAPLRFEAVFEAPTEIPGASFGFVIVNEDAVEIGGFSRQRRDRRRRPRRRARPGPRRAREPLRARSLRDPVLGAPQPLVRRAAARPAADPRLRRLRQRDHGRTRQDRRSGRADRRDQAEAASMSAASEPLELQDVHGPSALGGGRRRFLELLWLLSVTEFKRTYFGTVLGYFWSLLRPLLLFAVLLFVFTQIFRLGSEVENYAVLLLLNIVLFTFFQESTIQAVTSVVAQEGIVRKTQFPRLVIPLSIVLTGLMNLGLNLIVVFIFILAYGVNPMWTWLLLPVIVLALTVLTTAVSMLLSVLYVRFRDMLIIWTVAATMLFYATPLLYPIEVAPDGLKAPMMVNPLAVIFEQARVWIIDPNAPNAAEAAGSTWRLIPATVIFIGLCVLAWRVFTRQAPRVAEAL